MLLLISPAKSLNFEKPALQYGATQPRQLAESEKLVEIARKLERVDLMQMMDVSEKIADLNVERFATWQQPFTEENAKPAVFAFTGDVYQGMKAENWSQTDADFAQKHLRILSGLYGVLRPLDLMQAYRLEMGISLKNQLGNNLYAFWKNKIAPVLKQDLAAQGDDILINLASNEYFSAVDNKQLGATIYNVAFKELRGNVYKVISFNAKRARGEMASFIIKNRLKSVADLRTFQADNYFYNEEMSSEFELVFTKQ